MKTLITLALLALPAFAAQDPNLEQEGNKTIVKAEACLNSGGKIVTDKRYYVCDGGKYDGYITSGPAGNVCSYKLKNQDYWEDASGTLTLNGKNYSCKTIMIGEDQVTLCRGNQRNVFPFVVGFDGAEASYFVSNGVFNAKVICSGTAK